MSDFEDDESPAVLRASASVSSHNRLKAVLEELEAERQARKEAETTRADLQAAFSRLKSFTYEAVRQRDEAVRLREEAESSKNDLGSKLSEALLWRDDAIKQRDDAFKQRDDAFKSRDEISLHRDVAIHARDSSRSDIEAAARLLVAGADRITARVSSIKSFGRNLPRSSSHTGVAAIAYGFTKRAEEIVDELVRHQDITAMDRSAMRDQMEQRHYQNAIEVSELEASVQILKDDLSMQTSELEKWQNLTAEKEGRISEIEQMASDKLIAAEKETLALTSALQSAESKIENVKACIKELSQLIFKAHETLANHAVSFFPTQTHLTKIPSVPSNSDEPEEAIRNCIDRLKEVVELFLKLGVTWKEHIELRKKALEDSEGTITRLIVEKKEITNFLKSALAIKQEMLEAVSRLSVDNNHNLNTVTKNREVRNENVGSSRGHISRTEGSLGDELQIGEAIGMAFALENEIKKSRQEIFELQQFLAVARGEVEWLRVTSERQMKELSEKAAKIQDLEEKQFLAQETIEGFRADLAAADEDIFRWKQAATKEAEAGATLFEEVERCQEQIAFLKDRTRQLSDSLEDSNNKLRSKEEMAAAAIAARNAAERSLRIADERAVQLRKRIEDMARQFELLEGKDDGATPTGWFDACWPYQWVRGRLPDSHGNPTPRPGDEMEKLLEPFV